MGKKDTSQDAVKQEALNQYNASLTAGPTPTQQNYTNFQNNLTDQYNSLSNQNQQTYGNLMQNYQNFQNGLSPTTFTYQNVSAPRPGELNEAYGALREALPGYREFANTGGYSDQDIRELRARGVSPIRAAYQNTLSELDRTNRIGGAANYIAARSRAQRELPQQLADATTNVNAGLADAIRQGKLAGLQGMTTVGSNMGSLSSAEAGRILQAALANQNADLQSQALSEQSRNNIRNAYLGSLSGMGNLYGTSVGTQNNMIGQLGQTYSNMLNNQNQQTGLQQDWLRIAMGNQQQQDQPWWKTALGIGGTIAPYLGMLGGGGNQQGQGVGGGAGWITPVNIDPTGEEY